MYRVIYLITCLVNGMKYIGQTSRTIEERFKEHAKRKNTLIGKAIHDFGKENFTIVILEECENANQINEREKYWIAYFNCISPNGYNKTDGGQGGWKHTSDSCEKISVANSGENHPMFGKHHTDATKAKLSAGNTGRRQSEATKALLSSLQTTKHAVICIETKEIFDSVAAAVRRYKVNRANLILACKNHQRTVDGKHFWYLEDFNKATEIVIPPPKTKPQKRKVVCLETGEVFETIRQAAKWLGMVHGAVSRACRKNIRAGGYHWKFVDEIQE